MAPGGPSIVHNCSECLRTRSINLKVLRYKDDDSLGNEINLNSEDHESKFIIKNQNESISC